MCDRLRQAYEKENGIRYDAVLRCRPDLLFESPLPDLSTLDLNYIYVPDFHMYEGCNDRLAIGNPATMTIYMKKIDDWHDYIAAWHRASRDAPPVTAEMFTAGQLRQYGIDVRLMPVALQSGAGPQGQNRLGRPPPQSPALPQGLRHIDTGRSFLK